MGWSALFPLSVGTGMEGRLRTNWGTLRVSFWGFLGRGKTWRPGEEAARKRQANACGLPWQRQVVGKAAEA